MNFSYWKWLSNLCIVTHGCPEFQICKSSSRFRLAFNWQHKIHMLNFELDIAPVTPNWFLFLPDFTPFNPWHYFPPRWLNQIPRSHSTYLPLQIQIVKSFSVFHHLLQNTLQQCCSLSKVFISYFTLKAFTQISLTSAPTQRLLRSLTVMLFILPCSPSFSPL